MIVLKRQEMKKIRVLHTEWSDGWGGQEIRIITEMKALREKGIEFFLATRPHAKIKQKALEEGFMVFDVPFKGNFDINSIFQLKKIIKNHKINIVNTHSGKDTWVGGIAAKLAGAKFIRTRHLSNPINTSRLNFINELADFIITTGEGVKEAMIKNNRINPKKIISIPTGVDEKIFDPAKYDKIQMRKKYNISLNKKVVGILAVLRSFKRHDIFVNLAKNFPNIEFIIAGDGPKKESIKKLINELNLKNIKMLGHIEKPAEILSAIDIQLLTSDSKEGVPQSLIQGLLMEKDIIASDVGSVKDLKQGNNLILVKPQINEFKKELENLLNKKTILSNKRKSMLDKFTTSQMAQKTLSIYKELK